MPGHRQCILHAGAAHQAYSLIVLIAADIDDLFPAAVQHQPCQLPGGAAVVIVHAGHLRKALPCDYYRHAAVLQGPRQLRRVAAPQQDDARHMVALHGFQVADLPLCVQPGVAQQHQIIFAVQLPGDALGDLPHRLRTDVGRNNAHLIYFSGAQGLGGGVRVVAGLFYHFMDGGAFLLAERAAVQITADRCAGHPRHFCNVTDGH